MSDADLFAAWILILGAIGTVAVFVVLAAVACLCDLIRWAKGER